MHQFHSNSKNTQVKRLREPSNKQSCVSAPYVKGLWKNILKVSQTRDINVGHMSNSASQCCFTKLKPTYKKGKQTNIVYKIKCEMAMVHIPAKLKIIFPKELISIPIG